MENSLSADHGEAGVSAQSHIAKPWVKRLLAGQGFHLTEEKQFWWGVHLDTSPVKLGVLLAGLWVLGGEPTRNDRSSSGPVRREPFDIAQGP